MKFVYCPAEILSALVAAGVDLRKLTCVEKLANIVSPEDVAFYLYVNMLSSEEVAKDSKVEPTVPGYISQSMPNALLAGKEAHEVFATNHPAADAIGRQLNEYFLNGNAPALQLQGKRLVSDLLDEHTILFSHKPLEAGEVSDAKPQGKQQMLYRLIQQLVTLRPFEEVAKLPVFGAYLQATKACVT